MTPRHSVSRSHVVIVGGAAALLILGGLGIATRLRAGASAQEEANAQAVPLIKVVTPAAGTHPVDLVLPGEVRAYVDAPVYARTTGYVKRWLVDLGQRVKAGQVLAELDTPEVDAQLKQADADLATSQANLLLAQSTYSRWEHLVAIKAVSQQDFEDKSGDLNAKRATRDAAQANVDRYQQLTSFKRVVAPFDGTITARNIDTGDLVQAGTGTAGSGSRELFHLVDAARLRVYVDVPQEQGNSVREVSSAKVSFPERPGETFDGQVVRTAGALNADTRTLRVEVDVDNHSGGLFGGAYAQVDFQLSPSKAVRLPINTLLFRADGLRVATLSAQQTVHLVDIKLGRDFGTEVEVVAGLNGREQVVLNPPDSVREGDRVRLPASTATVPTSASGSR